MKKFEKLTQIALSILKKITNINITYSRLFPLGILVFVCLYFVSFCLFGPSPVADFSTVLLGATLGCFMCVTLWQTRKTPSFDLFIVLAFKKPSNEP